MSRPLSSYDVQFGGFEQLMPNRVREILMVASPYDAFIIREDDRLTELIFSEYLDLNLRYAPRVTRVSNAEEALQELRQHRFDLIITMMRVGNMEIGTFSKKVKKIFPKLPIALLVYNPMDLERMSESEKAGIDRIFLWTGNAKILLSIIKLVEDSWNIDSDIKTAGVHSLLLIEDSVRFYSSYLPLIYTELMQQTQKLMAEGVNLTHKMLRMRARPKILLASNFEEASRLYARYRPYLLGLITDNRFPKNGLDDPKAGLDFIAQAKKDDPDLPILLQSSDAKLAEEAEALAASFLNKSSPTLLEELRVFIQDNMGFGDFIFRIPDGQIIGRVPDLHSMVKFLESVPEESLRYHASRNHFSKWLMARTEFELAYLIRPRHISEFKDLQELRKYLITTLSRALHQTELGVVTDFSAKFFSAQSPFVKIGKGSLGGKARGLAFFSSAISRQDFSETLSGAGIAVPNTAVIASDIFDVFLEQNQLKSLIHQNPEDEKLWEAFLQTSLPDALLQDLASLVEKVSYPLAVRSSSLMEDSQVWPLAGVYATYMLPNSHPEPSVRLRQLVKAIQLVYASTFTQQARSYLGSSPHLHSEEKMAVIVQKLVGKRYGDRFYPICSGVALSYNYYPVGRMKATDGVAYVRLGLGKAVVEGGRSLSFCPAYPQNLYQFSSAQDYLTGSQAEFLALDLSRSDLDPDPDPSANYLSLGLQEAEADGTLELVGSTYDPQDERLYDGTARPGARLVSFAPILKGRLFPLAEALRLVLEAGEQGVGRPVEIEFSVDVDAQKFYLLQIRPLASWDTGKKVSLEGLDRSRILCRSPKALGHGLIDSVTDIIYVKPETFQPSKSALIAREIGRVNQTLVQQGRHCMLIGPGRWGSADSLLGIPVHWGEISSARLIVETALKDFIIEPSYGTHFLHNVISLGIGYLTVNPLRGEGLIHWQWLGSQNPSYESEHLKHIRLDSPLDIRLDGRHGQGVALRPAK